MTEAQDPNVADRAATAQQLVPTRHRDPQAMDNAQTLGRYAILFQVDARKTGEVYAAYDPILDRKVALRLLPASGNSGHRSRLMLEVKALARLSHPHVVAVHEVDDYKGGALVAMEFVEGQPLCDWLLAHPVGHGEHRVAEALDLILQSGKGLAAAHAQGLVHGDFSPANVLVGQDGRVRVADFGLGSCLVEDTVASEHRGDEVMQTSGTASAYTAPEQLLGAEPDASGDLFSFCVTAWEVLFGVRPYQGKHLEAMGGGSRPEGLFRSNNVKLPERVENLLRGGLALQRSDRGPCLEVVLRELQEELDVLRGTAAQPKRWTGWRYLTVATILAGGLLAAERVQTLRLTQACADAADVVDLVWNPQRRRAVVTGLADTRLGRQTDLETRVTPWLDNQAEAWREHARTGCVQSTLEDSLTPHEYNKVRWCLEERRLELLALVDALVDADDLTAEGSIDAASGLTRVELCLDKRAIIAEVDPPGHHVRRELAQVRAQLVNARTLQAAGHYREALVEAKTARKQAEALAWMPLTAAAWVQESTLLTETGAYAEAEQAGIKGFVHAGKVGAWDAAARGATALVSSLGGDQRRPDEARLWAKLASLAISHAGDPLGLREAARLSDLGAVSSQEDKLEQALKYALKSLKLQQAALGARHPAIAVSMNNVGSAYWAMGQYEGAFPYHQRALRLLEASHGLHHPRVAIAYNNLGTTYEARGEYEDAQDAYETALSIEVQTLGDRHPDTAQTRRNLGELHFRMGNAQLSERALLDALSITEEVFGPAHIATAESYLSLGQLYNGTRPGESRILYLKALAAVRNAEATDLRLAGILYGELARLDLHQGRLDEALNGIRKSFETTSDILGNRHPTLAAILSTLGAIHHARGALQDALKAHTRALAIAQDVFDDDHPNIASIHGNIGTTHYAQHDYDTALAYLQLALKSRQSHLGPEHPLLALTFRNIGHTQQKLGRHEEALTAFRHALKISTKTSGPDHADTLKTRRAIEGLCAKRLYTPACTI